MMADLTVAYDGKRPCPPTGTPGQARRSRAGTPRPTGAARCGRNKAEVTNLASSQDDVVVLYAQWEDAMTAMPETEERWATADSEKPSGGLVFWPSSRPCWRDGACAETGSINRKGGVTC